MNYEIHDKDIVLKENNDFNIKQTLECGQCFHFIEISEMEYGYVHNKNLLHVRQCGDEIVFYNTSEKEFQNIWVDVFDLDRNYGSIKDSLIKADGRLKEVIDENYGVRIMNQEFVETLMSFIISQNKQIPHIKKIVNDISKKYGNYLGKIGEEEFYSFPDRVQIKNITEEAYRECKTGFRAGYLYDAGTKLANEAVFNRDYLRQAGYENASEVLKNIKGVGDKVANCVLLFSVGYRNAFPVDVWIKRIMEGMYFDGVKTDNKVIMDKAGNLFGENGGYAQQYLFCYAKSQGL